MKLIDGWNDGERTWINLTRNLEASHEYHGSHYVEIRNKDTHHRILLISEDMLDRISTLFNP